MRNRIALYLNKTKSKRVGISMYNKNENSLVRALIENGWTDFAQFFLTLIQKLSTHIYIESKIECIYNTHTLKVVR